MHKFFLQNKKILLKPDDAPVVPAENMPDNKVARLGWSRLIPSHWD